MRDSSCFYSWLLFPAADNEATNPRLMAACPQLYFFLRRLLLRLLSERGRKKTDVEWRFTHSGAKYIEQ